MPLHNLERASAERESTRQIHADPITDRDLEAELIAEPDAAAKSGRRYFATDDQQSLEKIYR
jgi:hypothetical protein